jgi:hypothetical protein
MASSFLEEQVKKKYQSQGAKNPMLLQASKGISAARPAETPSVKLAKQPNPFARGGLAVRSGVESGVSGQIGAVNTFMQLGSEKLAKLFGMDTNSQDYKELYGQTPTLGVTGLTAESLRSSAATDITKAKEGTGKVGSFALDALSTGANMGTAAATSFATGIPFVAAMGVQGGGASAMSAKEQGKTLEQQAFYGLTSGLAEAAIESIGGIGASKVAKATAGKAASALMSKLPSAVGAWLSKAGASTAGGILKSAVSEAAEEAISYDVDRVLQKIILQNDVPRDIKEQAYQALLGGTMGGVFGGGQAIMQGISNAKAAQPTQAAPQAAHETATAPTLPTAETTQTGAEMGAQAMETTAPENQIHISSEPIANESVGAADAGFDTVGNLVNQYGAIPEGMNPAADRVVEIPQQVTPDTQVSRAARSAAEATATPRSFVPTIEQFVVDGKASYIPLPNDRAAAKATELIEKKGFQTALADWSRAVGEGKTSADIVAQGAILYNNAVNAGDGETALNILSDYIELTRNTAQGLQAASMIKRLTPQGKLYTMQKTVSNLNEQLGVDSNVQIDPALASEFLNAPDDVARDAALDKIYQNIADQVPSTLMDKWTALRYLNMLGNFKTQVRNIAGNAAFQPARMVKDRVGALLEIGADKLNRAKGGTGIQRTKSFVYNPALFKVAVSDFANVRAEAMGEAKYSSQSATGNAEIEDRRTIFKFKPLETYRKLTKAAMEYGDIGFSLFTYSDTLAGYLNANGVTAEQMNSGTVDPELLDKARSYAVKEAQKATYRDKNAFSGMIQGIGFKNAQGNKAKQAANVAIQGTIPFRRTPANILVRAFEYSPLELAAQIRNVGKAANGDTVSIDKIASGMTGTGLFALGMYLFTHGLVSGGEDDDKKQAAFDDLTGRQPYALYLPDGTNVTLDWLAPESIPFFMGVELARNGLENGYTLASVIDAAQSITNPMLQMSMLQGVNDQINSVSYSDNGLVDLALNALISYASQGLTSTLGGQAERSFENVRMTTYTEKGGALPTDLQYALGRMSAKVPGADYKQIPYINAWGGTEASGSVLENFLSPAYVSKSAKDATEKELQRLYDKTGESVLPQRAAKSFTFNGAEYNLTADEYVQFATTKGKTSKELLDSILKNPQYSSMNDSEKAELVKSAYTAANDIAKQEIITSRGERASVDSKVMQAEASGISPLNYILWNAALKKYGGSSISQEEAQHVIDNKLKLPKEQASIFWGIINKSWKTNPYK